MEKNGNRPFCQRALCVKATSSKKHPRVLCFIFTKDRAGRWHNRVARAWACARQRIFLLFNDSFSWPTGLLLHHWSASQDGYYAVCALRRLLLRSEKALRPIMPHSHIINKRSGCMVRRKHQICNTRTLLSTEIWVLFWTMPEPITKINPANNILKINPFDPSSLMIPKI